MVAKQIDKKGAHELPFSYNNCNCSGEIVSIEI